MSNKAIIKYNLAKITDNCKVSLNVIVNVNELRSFRGKVYNTSTIIKRPGASQDYYNVMMSPFIEIECTSIDDIIEARTNGNKLLYNKIILTKYNLFRFLTTINKIKASFTEKENLFYYRDNKSYLNPEVGESISEEEVFGTTRVKIGPMVLSVGGGEKDHEGVYISINNFTIITYLTYNELCYLRYVLISTDIDNLAVQLVNLVGKNQIVTIVNDVVVDIYEDGSRVTTKEEKDDSEIIESSNNKLIDNDSTIPPI